MKLEAPCEKWPFTVRVKHLTLQEQQQRGSPAVHLELLSAVAKVLELTTEHCINPDATHQFNFATAKGSSRPVLAACRELLVWGRQYDCHHLDNMPRLYAFSADSAVSPCLGSSFAGDVPTMRPQELHPVQLDSTKLASCLTLFGERLVSAYGSKLTGLRF